MKILISPWNLISSHNHQKTDTIIASHLKNKQKVENNTIIIITASRLAIFFFFCKTTTITTPPSQQLLTMFSYFKSIFPKKYQKSKATREKNTTTYFSLLLSISFPCFRSNSNKQLIFFLQSNKQTTFPIFSPSHPKRKKNFNRIHFFVVVIHSFSS